MIKTGSTQIVNPQAMSGRVTATIIGNWPGFALTKLDLQLSNEKQWLYWPTSNVQNYTYNRHRLSVACHHCLLVAGVSLGFLYNWRLVATLSCIRMSSGWRFYTRVPRAAAVAIQLSLTTVSRTTSGHNRSTCLLLTSRRHGHVCATSRTNDKSVPIKISNKQHIKNAHYGVTRFSCGHVCLFSWPRGFQTIIDGHLVMRVPRGMQTQVR